MSDVVTFSRAFPNLYFLGEEEKDRGETKT